MIEPAMVARVLRKRAGGNAALQQAGGAAGGATVLPVALLLVSFVIPWLFPIGPVALSAYRLVLLALIGPTIIIWASGKAGRVRLPDVAVLCYCLWCVIAMVAVDGEGTALEAGGALVLESLGAYLVARCFIRSAEQFVTMIRIAFWIIACLTPFALVETVTGMNLARSLFSAILPTYQPVAPNDLRAGLTRAMVIFEHPILFGVFTASMLALVHLVLGHEDSPALRWGRSLIVSLAAACSLSSGPLGVMAMQIVLLAWNWIFRRHSWRWPLIWVLLVLSYIAIDLFSNQSPLQVYVSRLAFNQDSAWYRFLIWDYGTASILANPLFGVGFGYWERPHFMSDSFDMFWLLPALRHGIAAGVFLYVAFASIYFGVMLKTIVRPDLARMRIAYVIMLTAYCLTGWAVHFWGVSYAMFFFLLGAGIWLLDPQPGAEPVTEGQVARHRSGDAVFARRQRALPGRLAQRGQVR